MSHDVNTYEYFNISNNLTYIHLNYKIREVYCRTKERQKDINQIKQLQNEILFFFMWIFESPADWFVVQLVILKHLDKWTGSAIIWTLVKGIFLFNFNSPVVFDLLQWIIFVRISNFDSHFNKKGIRSQHMALFVLKISKTSYLIFVYGKLCLENKHIHLFAKEPWQKTITKLVYLANGHLY